MKLGTRTTTRKATREEAETAGHELARSLMGRGATAVVTRIRAIYLRSKVVFVAECDVQGVRA